MLWTCQEDVRDEWRGFQIGGPNNCNDILAQAVGKPGQCPSYSLAS